MNTHTLSRKLFFIFLVSFSVSKPNILTTKQCIPLARNVVCEKFTRETVQKNFSTNQYSEDTATIASHTIEALCLQTINHRSNTNIFSYIFFGSIIKICVNHTVDMINHVAGHNVISTKKHQTYIKWGQVTVGQLLCNYLLK